MEFTFGGGDPGSGGSAALFVGDQQVAEGAVENTVAFVFSADETANVGLDSETPVTEAYAEGDNDFNGGIRQITIALAEQ